MIYITACIFLIIYNILLLSRKPAFIGINKANVSVYIIIIIIIIIFVWWVSTHCRLTGRGQVMTPSVPRGADRQKLLFVL